MGTVENMENETNCIETIFQSYVTQKSEYGIFLFFEGKDDYKYYCQRVTMYSGENKPKIFNCEGKNNVLNLEKMIFEQTTKKDKKTLYFVDSDYDENNNIRKSIYVTTPYSIENYYITDSALERILQGMLGFSEEKNEDKDDLNNSLKYIKDNRDKIIQDIIYTNAWYSLQIKKSKKHGVLPSLENIKEYSKIKGIKERSKLEKMTKNTIKVTEHEINDEINSIKICPVHRIRGKYLVQALKPVFTYVFTDSCKKKNRELFSKKRKVKNNLQDIILEFSAFADTPKELSDYIQNRLR